jgi:hypothetical protein
MNARKVEGMDYGTPAQHKAADAWYARFLRFAESHPLLAEAVWNRLHLNDVWYTARRRWLDLV